MARRYWFAFYARHFDAVEINASFYRLPSPELFERWRHQAPEGFCCAVKANRYLTQSKKLKDCVEPIARMMSPTRHLRDRLGPVLYQLPPTLKLDLARLEAFLRLLPRDLVHVFEFRDPTWYSDAVLALLDGFGAGFVAHDFPDRASPRWACGNAAYVRFHGATGKYQGRYAASTLRSWADWMIGQASARPVWAFFNNDIDAAAPDDAGRLRAMVG
ncbi:DUF72 domain-containing protein [Sphingomonas crocodyli]|uniref:DUF72 domain-containing protein n=1 Tax=Sphingomonas crocodyli TaxID=1979270 RepID=A0A437LYE4_9SPHN|nr:DUF72 domain-containing protein [Sphingomonas crocodyli]RVT90353.1 DUF72 domain-containing protein [Sphingomonas crocodyli]